MLRDFIAIDFETANQEPSSVCSVGVIMVREGQIVDSFYSLIHSLSQTTIIIGVSGCMVFHKTTQTMRQYFPKYGSSWRSVLSKCIILIKKLTT